MAAAPWHRSVTGSRRARVAGRCVRPAARIFGASAVRHRPRLYGHFCVLPGMDGADVQDAHRVLADFAERGGYKLVRVFVQDSPRHLVGTWTDMTAALFSEQEPALVVLSPEHLHPHPALARHVRDEVTERTGATVLFALPTPAATNRQDSAGDQPTSTAAQDRRTNTCTCACTCEIPQ